MYWLQWRFTTPPTDCRLSTTWPAQCKAVRWVHVSTYSTTVSYRNWSLLLPYVHSLRTHVPKHSRISLNAHVHLCTLALAHTSTHLHARAPRHSCIIIYMHTTYFLAHTHALILVLSLRWKDNLCISVGQQTHKYEERALSHSWTNFFFRFTFIFRTNGWSEVKQVLPKIGYISMVCLTSQ